MDRKKIALTLFLIIIVASLIIWAIFAKEKKFSDSPSGTAPKNIAETNGKENSLEKLQRNLEQFYTTQTSLPLNWGNVVDSASSGVAIQDFLKETSSSIDNGVLTFVRSRKDYDVFSCAESGETHFGLYLTRESLKNYSGDLYGDGTKALEFWESNMLRDLYSVLYPNDSISAEVASRPLVFPASFSRLGNSEIQYKASQESLNSGKSVRIFYGIVENYIVITTSGACLERASNALYELVP